MPITERSRSVLYRRLNRMTEDEEAVGEMLTQLTAVEANEVATKDFVRVEIATASTRIIMWMVSINLIQLGVLVAIFR